MRLSWALLGEMRGPRLTLGLITVDAILVGGHLVPVLFCFCVIVRVHPAWGS